MKFLKKLLKWVGYLFLAVLAFSIYSEYTMPPEEKARIKLEREQKQAEKKRIEEQKQAEKDRVEKLEAEVKAMQAAHIKAEEEKKKWADSLEASVSQKCHRAIESGVTNPATLDIKYFSGSASQKIEATKTIIYSVRFTAQNDFGVEKRFTAYCRGDTDGSFSFNAEQGFTN